MCKHDKGTLRRVLGRNVNVGSRHSGRDSAAPSCAIRGSACLQGYRQQMQQAQLNKHNHFDDVETSGDGSMQRRVVPLVASSIITCVQLRIVLF